MAYQLVVPEDFDGYAWEVEAKGVFWDATIKGGGPQFSVTFYDASRLAQDIAAEIAAGRPFIVQRLIVVKRITREAMVQAVESIPPQSLG